MQEISTRHPIRDDIHHHGYSLVQAQDMLMSEELRAQWQHLLTEYSALPRDNYLPDNGLYRYRRYDSFYYHPQKNDLLRLPHQDYFQSTDINQVTGGIVRKFAPLTDETAGNPFLHALIRFDFAHFPLASPDWFQHTWQVDVHQIYVVAPAGAEGHPTPEGVHRDGAEFVTVHLAVLDNATGGEVSIYDDDKKHLDSFTLESVLDSYLFNDAILWHGVKPIQSCDGIAPAQRGILTFDFHYKPTLERPSQS